MIDCKHTFRACWNNSNDKEELKPKQELSESIDSLDPIEIPIKVKKKKGMIEIKASLVGVIVMGPYISCIMIYRTYTTAYFTSNTFIKFKVDSAGIR